MGKLVQLIGLLVFIDMIFFLFSSEDLASISLTSIIFLSIKYGSFEFIKDNLFKIFTSSGTSLLAAGGVYALSWLATGKRETATWVAIALTFLLNLTADFIVIYNYLAGIHRPLTYYLATILMVPIAIIYIFIALEWVRGKD